MFKLKTKKDGLTTCKKFGTIQEVTAEMHRVLFGYTAFSASLAEMQAACAWQDLRFYLSYKKD